MPAADPYPPGPPGTSPSPSDKYFEGLTYSRATNALWLGIVLGIVGTVASLGITGYRAQSRHCSVGLASHSVRYC